MVVDDDGTTQFTIIEAKNYKDFQEKYKKASERVRSSVQKMKSQDTLENVGKSSTIIYKESSTIEEAKKYAKDNYNLGFWSTGNVEHAIRHETGHAIQHWLTDNNSEKLKK